MKVERKRRGRSVAETLKAVSDALLWGASEIHIHRDRYVLEVNAQPPDVSAKTLSDLTRSATVHPVRIGGDPSLTVHNVFDVCRRKKLYFAAVFAKTRDEFFGWAGIPVAKHAWGVPVHLDSSIPEGTVLFGLSKVPFGSLSSIHVLLKGELDHVD